MYYFIPAWYGQTDEFWKLENTGRLSDREEVKC